MRSVIPSVASVRVAVATAVVVTMCFGSLLPVRAIVTRVASIMPSVASVLLGMSIVMSIPSHVLAGVVDDPVAAPIEASLDPVSGAIELVRKCVLPRRRRDEGEKVELVIDHLAAPIELAIHASRLVEIRPGIRPSRIPHVFVSAVVAVVST